MKRKTNLILLIVTLAIFAGVFSTLMLIGTRQHVAKKCAVGMAFASGSGCGFSTPQNTFLPWNVHADVVYKNTVVCYNLQQEMQPYLENASNRGFYLGCDGKKRLADSLFDMGLPPCAVYQYLLPQFSSLVAKFHFVNVEKRDATVTFDKDGFHYTEGCDGISVDAQKLFELLLESGGRHVTISLPLAVDKAVTVQQLKQNTVEKATFTTHYKQSGANRCFNIKKAAQSINGTVVDVGETFSFNQVVGPRTAENGYKQSKVILDGNYTDGVGGGVCQVSTTLYNALLLSEFIPNAQQHSLVSSYVLAGFDAMVAYGSADLTFTNDTQHPIYISATADTAAKSVTFTIYGQPNTYKVVRESVEQRTPYGTVEIVDKVNFPELVYTDQTKIVTSGSDGVKSKSYLNYYSDGKLVKRQLIRQNSYKKVDRVVAHGDVVRPADAPPEIAQQNGPISPLALAAPHGIQQFAVKSEFLYSSFFTSMSCLFRKIIV